MTDRYPGYTDYRQPRRPADERGDGEPPAPKSKWFDRRMNVGHWITICVIVIGGAVTWGEMKSQAQDAHRRLTDMERKEVEIRQSYERLKEQQAAAQAEIKADLRGVNENLRGQQRTLDRIEKLLDNRRPGSPLP